MNKASERRPTYKFTQAESLFLNLIKHSKYRDSDVITKSMVRMKTSFIRKNLDKFEKRVQTMKFLDSMASYQKEHSRIGKSVLGFEDNLSKLSENLFSLREETGRGGEQSMQEPINRANGNDNNRNIQSQNNEGKRSKESKEPPDVMSYNREEIQEKIDEARKNNMRVVVAENGSIRTIPKKPAGTRNRRRKKKKRNKKSSLNAKLMYIDNNTGQYMVQGEPVEGYNVFGDLNYGDMIMVFKNSLYDFMLDEKEKVNDKMHMVDKAEKRRKRPLGLMDKGLIEKMRAKEEKRALKQLARIRSEKKMIFSSLGFAFTRDMLMSKTDRRKLSKQKQVNLATEHLGDEEEEHGYEVYEDEVEIPKGMKPQNVPGHSRYGRGGSGSEFEMKLSDAWDIFQKRINVFSEIKQVNKDYLMNEKIAFVNALLFYSKENYFKSYTLERMEYVYHESSYAQKPFTEHCMPKLAAFFLENDLSELFKRVKISEKEKKDNEKFERFRFSYLFEPNKFLMRRLEHLVIDKRILAMLIQRTILLKMNRVGLFTRKFYSEDLKNIFIVIKAQDNLLRQVASQQGYSLQLELGHTDIFSIQPVDAQLRPYNKKSRIFKEFKDMKKKEREILGEAVELNSNADKKQELGKQDDESFDYEKEVREIKEKGAGEGKGYNPFLIIPKANAIVEVIKTIGLVEKMNHSKLLKALKYQRREIGGMFSKLRDFLSYPSERNSKLVEDKMKNRSKWTAFYVYLSLLEKWRRDLRSLIRSAMAKAGESMTSGKSSQMKKNIDPTLEKMNTGGAVASTVKVFSGLFWRLIMMKAIGDTNEAFTEYNRNWFQRCFGCGKYNKRRLKAKKLKSLWDYYQYSPMTPFMEYDTKEAMVSKWRYYEINELGHRDIFRTMDRLKLLDIILPELFDIYNLAQPGSMIMDGFTPLHDPYELKKMPKMPLFDEIPEVIASCEIPDYLDSFLSFIKALSDEAEPRDFIVNSLREKLTNGCFGQLEVDEGPIQNYFGEKIGLYFLYLKYFARRLKFIGILGIITFALESVFLYLGNIKEEQELKLNGFIKAYHYMIYVFAFIVTVWSTMFIEYWKRKEKLYAIKYGQLNFEAKQKDRPSFKGMYRRNLGSSEMNEVYFSQAKRTCRKLIGFMVSFIIVLLSTGVTMGLLIWKNWMDRNNPGFLATYAPPALNSIAATLFKMLYEKISKGLNFYENHQNVTSFEDSLVLKKYIFNFFNSFHPYFILAFIKPILGDFGECLHTSSSISVTTITLERNDCYNELVTYVRTHFLVGFVLNFLEILVPVIQDRLFLKQVKLKKEYPWGMIDRMIEMEWREKDPYQTTMEIDGVLNEYMEIALLFTFLALFGQVFPIGFFLAFLTMFCEIYIDKFKFLHQIRRPIPKGASDIGSWNMIIKIISFVAIFVNVALLTFTSQSSDFVATEILNWKSILDDPASLSIYRFQHFVFVSLFLVLVRRVVEEIVPDIPTSLNELLIRQQLIKEKMKFKKKQMTTSARTGLIVRTYNDSDMKLLFADQEQLNLMRDDPSNSNVMANKKKRKKKKVTIISQSKHIKPSNNDSVSIRSRQALSVKPIKPSGDSVEVSLKKPERNPR